MQAQALLSRGFVNCCYDMHDIRTRWIYDCMILGTYVSVFCVVNIKSSFPMHVENSVTSWITDRLLCINSSKCALCHFVVTTAVISINNSQSFILVGIICYLGDPQMLVYCMYDAIQLCI